MTSIVVADTGAAAVPAFVTCFGPDSWTCPILWPGQHFSSELLAPNGFRLWFTWPSIQPLGLGSCLQLCRKPGWASSSVCLGNARLGSVFVLYLASCSLKFALNCFSKFSKTVSFWHETLCLTTSREKQISNSKTLFTTRIITPGKNKNDVSQGLYEICGVTTGDSAAGMGDNSGHPAGDAPL